VAVSVSPEGMPSSYTPPLTRLLLHASSYTPSLTRLLSHAFSYTPPLTHLLLHTSAYTPPTSDTPPLTRLLLHASYKQHASYIYPPSERERATYIWREGERERVPGQEEDQRREKEGEREACTWPSSRSATLVAGARNTSSPSTCFFHFFPFFYTPPKKK
jgi:hypothetical protein